MKLLMESYKAEAETVEPEVTQWPLLMDSLAVK